MDNSVQGDAVGEKWHATLRSRVASQTATTRRARRARSGGHSGEGAR
ncbi:DUF6380 family protein [Streptomyces resistomycificus]